jgi:hypothetical protein
LQDQSRNAGGDYLENPTFVFADTSGSAVGATPYGLKELIEAIDRYEHALHEEP